MMSTIIPINPEEMEKEVSPYTFIEISFDSLIKRDKTKIKIDGEMAFINSEFTSRFNGDFSSYEEQDSSVLITIDPNLEFENGRSIKVSVLSETVDGSEIFKNYTFKIEESGPRITESNFVEGDILNVPQILFFQIQDYDQDIDISSMEVSLNGTLIIKNGESSANYTGGSSEIVSSDRSVSVKIIPDEAFRDGPYNLYLYIENSIGEKLRKNIKFSVKLDSYIHPPIFPPGSTKSFRIVEASPVGDGKSIKVKWLDSYKRIFKSDSYVLTYIGEKRLNIIDELPKYITIDQSTTQITVSGLSAGKQYYVLNRVLETYKNAFNFSNLNQYTDNTYEIPSATKVSDFLGTDDLTLSVESVAGYPESGLLLLGGIEVVKYNSINESQNQFIIDPSGRGLNETSRGVFITGDDVKLFLACQDKNLNIVAVTPVYSEEHSGPERNLVGMSVTNYEDQDKKFNQSYDYCGYHSKLPQNTLNGIDDCGTYLGGEFNGMRGFNLFDRMVAREEVLLDQTGEPCVLFKRKWSGQACSCTNNKARHPRIKTCGACYGTGFVGGFDQFINRKRFDTRLQLSFGDTVEDLKLDANKGLNIQYEPSCWTLPYPTIRDRDVVLRFDYTNDTEYFYEVLDVTREKSIYLHYTRQRVRLKRLEKTDIYQTLQYTKKW